MSLGCSRAGTPTSPASPSAPAVQQAPTVEQAPAAQQAPAVQQAPTVQQAPAASADAVASLLAGARIERGKLEVLRALPHDAMAFTEGLVMLDDHTLLESTGLYGQSTIREVDLETGQVRRARDLPPDLFGEGLALVGDRVFQLTWREQLALVYRAADLEMVQSYRYEGEGWGLCYDGSRLVMSDGSSRLTFRSPDDLGATGAVTVTAGGAEVQRVNELECVGDTVYANVWQTDYILAISVADGVVRTVIDASGLLAPTEKAGADVLNGIAYRASTGTFLVTGKLWPKLFEVRLTPSGAP
jgi:glutamine cyclotransferase